MPFEHNGRAPLVFSPSYDLAIGENLTAAKYPFDFSKRGRAFQMASKALGIKGDTIFSPREASDRELELVHPRKYLTSLLDPFLISRVMGIPELATLSSSRLEENLLQPLRLATGGTILGARLALEHGWAFNFSGGFHHAHAERAEGFCFYADTAVAVHSLWEQQPDLNVIIVDVDAHGMNGLWEILGHDPRITLFDIYNREIYPVSGASELPYPQPRPGSVAKSRGDFSRFFFPVESLISDRDYLSVLWRNLPLAIASVPEPRLMICHLGQDPFRGDRLGHMNLSEQAILRRDAYLFDQAIRNNVPVLSLLAGGYSPNSAGLIAKSLLNIVHRSMDGPLNGLPPYP